MLTASVVIVSRNKPEYLAATLSCLARQTRPPEEVLVIDDASEPPLACLPGMTRLVRREAGVAHLQAARNLGICLAQGDLVFLMDDDCLVREDWVEAHRRRHARDPGHLVVGSVRRIVYHGESAFWDLPAAPDVDEFRTFERRAGLLTRNLPPWDLAPCSNNASIAREALARVAGYDEEYVGWGVDDVDLTYRLMAAGVPLLIDSALWVYHQEHPRHPEQQETEERHNLWVFARRHGFWPYGVPPVEYSGPRWYPPDGIWFHAQTLDRPGEPEAIQVTRVAGPRRDALHTRRPLDCIVGGGADAVVGAP